MKLPQETPVMTLPNATLFPQTLLPLCIFEPRYRRMLTDALHSNRMFAVAMQRPGNRREVPLPVAGLGVVRVSVGHRDGTSHLILQGVARVGLERTVRYRPYRVNRIAVLQTPPCDGVTTDALLEKVRELLEERLHLGLPFRFPPISASQSVAEIKDPSTPFSPRVILDCIDAIHDTEQAVDLVSCAVLPDARERQTILETVDVESRLRRLIQFLLAEIQKQRKGREHE